MLTNNKDLRLTAGKFKIKAPADMVSGEHSVLVSQTVSSQYVLAGETEKRNVSFCQGLCYKSTNVTNECKVPRLHHITRA